MWVLSLLTRCLLPLTGSIESPIGETGPVVASKISPDADRVAPGASKPYTKVRPPGRFSFKSEYAFCVVKRGAVKMFRSTGKHLSLAPDFRMDISRLRLMVVMRSSNSSRAVLFYLYLFIFPIIFLGGYLFNYSLQPDPFIRSVPSLLPLSLSRPLRRFMRRRRRYDERHDL